MHAQFAQAQLYALLMARSPISRLELSQVYGESSKNLR